jgi:hypothetical protein
MYHHTGSDFYGVGSLPLVVEQIEEVRGGEGRGGRDPRCVCHACRFSLLSLSWSLLFMIMIIIIIDALVLERRNP